ncbi:MAG: SRPBCC domain-containing protein, partial [Pyrinomonadaceae bacterium]|nr:SRPBCC domain-containing protein [Pyrinomonadaceae bacterium]
METRRHIHEEPFGVGAESMFHALITPSAIREWWGASKAIVIAEKGGVWIAAWGEDENDSDYISSFKILEFEPPRRMLLGDGKYQSRDGQPPFEMNMTTEFTVEPVNNGCILRIVQD